MPVAFIGLGSNLGDRQANLMAAVSRLGLERSVRIVSLSSIYETKPVGRIEQPSFLNAVAKIETGLSPGELLDRMMTIENSLGRIRTVRWGPRTIDLDLLLYEDLILNSPGLILPHPEMTRRFFVLAPLAEIAPELKLPGGQTPAQCLAALVITEKIPDSEVVRYHG